MSTRAELESLIRTWSGIGMENRQFLRRLPLSTPATQLPELLQTEGLPEEHVVTLSAVLARLSRIHSEELPLGYLHKQAEALSRERLHRPQEAGFGPALAALCYFGLRRDDPEETK